MRSLLTGVLLMFMQPANDSVHTPPRGTTAIVLSSGPCLTGCPIFTVEVRPDDTARYRGIQFVTVVGRRTLRLPRRRFADIEALLAPVRPSASRRIDAASPDCGPHRTDQSSLGVVWRDGAGETELHVDVGCTGADGQRAVRLVREALATLPLAGLVYRKP